MPCVKEVLVEDWASYQAEVDQILENCEARRSTTSKGLVSAPLFRGQSNQSWPPLTTLERFSAKSWSIKRYHRLLQSVGPAVFSLTSKAWNLGEDPDNVDQSRHIPPPAYEFMIYLRHYGFPSPLLDWSRSPYVAAFFAFEHQPTVRPSPFTSSKSTSATLSSSQEMERALSGLGLMLLHMSGITLSCVSTRSAKSL